MCTTIQVALPAQPTAWDVGRRMLDRGEVEPIGDIDGAAMLLISTRQCECGTPLGSASTPAQWNADSYARDLRRLKKRGWSEHKIERWLEAKHSTHAKLERLAHERTDGPSAEPVDSWLDFLANALESGVGQIGLRVCHGDDSWSATTPHATVHITEVTAADLRAMEENALYVFVP